MIGVLLFLRANWKLVAIGAAVMGLVLALLAYGAHERHIQKVQDLTAAEQAREAAAARNAAAIAKADEQRAKDQAATATLEKDLTHAYAQTPDSKPSASRLALACERLRRAGGPGAKLPAACGPAR